MLIDAVAPTGRCDVTGAIAYIWPSQAFLTVMGVPVDHPAGVAGWMQEGSHNDGDSQFGLLNWLAATIAEHFDRRPPVSCGVCLRTSTPVISPPTRCLAYS